MGRVLETGSAASVDMSNIATEMAASSSEVNAAPEEISSTTQEVSQKAQNQVESLVEISKIASNIISLSHEILVSTNNINKVMDLITGISDQTSIEARRAGEHGCKFAVIADEVRNLREESKNTVEKTSNSVTDIVSCIEITIELIRSVRQDIEAAISAGEEDSRALEEIRGSTEQ